MNVGRRGQDNATSLWSSFRFATCALNSAGTKPKVVPKKSAWQLSTGTSTRNLEMHAQPHVTLLG